MNDEKKSWLDRAGAVHLWKTIEAMLGTKVDKIEGFGLSSNDYTTEEKKKLASLSDPDVATTENNGLMSSADKAKLDGIEAGANNYTHPVYEAKQAGLYRISVDNTGHVATADKMTSEELAAEGVSPADHTHDLGELVDTLETSADAVEDADTVIVGATVTSDDGSATTKYTRRPLATLWNWIKAKADTLYAAVGHTHNYAGSTEPGGDALNAMKLNGLSTSIDGDKKVYGTIPTVSANSGLTELGKYIDFHATKDSGEDFDARFVANGDGQILLNKTASGNGDGTLKANLLGNASSADYATETQIDRGQTVDLSSLDQNTWYPVVTQCGWPGLHHIKCNVQLNSGTKPSWSTHSSGFTAVVELLTLSPGWGITGGHCICLCNDQRFISDSSKPPVGYTMMWNGSMCVFWLRGGGRYHLYADYKTTQSLQTSSYTNNNQTVSPTTSYPGISYNFSTQSNSYPVGAIYMSTDSTSPASIFGGSWQSIASERVLMGVSSSHGAGSTVSAGLPNITGVLKDLVVSGHFNESTGAFKRSYASGFSQKTSNSDWMTWADAQFYASDSNSIYGNASTVQPAAYYVYMWRRTG